MTSDLSANEGFPRARIAPDRQPNTKPRDRQSNRYWKYVAVLLGLLACLILAAPSILSHTLVVRTKLARIAGKHGLSVDVGRIRVGWCTPLRLSRVRIESDTFAQPLHIDRITSNLTLVGLLFGAPDSLGDWVITGVSRHCAVDRLGTDQNLISLLKGASSGDPLTSGSVRIQDISLSVTDSASKDSWQLKRSSVEINLHPRSIDAVFSGVSTEPGGGAGSFRGKLLAMVPSSPAQPPAQGDAITESSDRQWQFEIKSQSLPLSVLTLISGPVPCSDSETPLAIGGEASGVIRLEGAQDGTITAVLDGFEVANLRVDDPATQNSIWSNRLASLDGQITLTSDRLIVQELSASNDFATIEIDGAFSRSSTLRAVREDPSKWLAATDAAITASIDVAKLQGAMPEALTLPNASKVVSGNIRLKTEPLSSETAHRRRFSLQLHGLSAETSDGIVAFDPIDFGTILAYENGVLRAEELRLQSQFAKVDVRGDLKRGSADFALVLGPLAEKLNRIVNTSDVRVGGEVDGDVRWNLDRDDVWRLTASVDASELRLTWNGAEAFNQNELNGKVKLSGRWGTQSLAELSLATMTLAGEGLDLRAELIHPVRQPTAMTSLPMQIEATGRLEKLTSIIHSWTMKPLREVEGDFDLTVQGDLSVASGRLTQASLDISELRVAWENGWFDQDSVAASFDGQWSWPSGDFQAKSLTAQCDAIKAALRGKAGPSSIDLDIVWRASLERISSSFHDRDSARSRSRSRNPTAQTTALRMRLKQSSDDWQVRGDCKGRLHVGDVGKQIEIRGAVSGKQLMLLERQTGDSRGTPSPPTHKKRVQVVSSVNPTPTTRSSPDSPQNLRVIWTEPELDLDGIVRYDPMTQIAVVETVRLAGDWVSTTLSGQAIWNTDQRDLSLKGPMCLKLPELGRHLTRLADVEVQMEGTHVAPLKIHWQQDNSGPSALAVDGTLGWDSGKIAGLCLGPTSIPVHLSEESLKVSPCVVPAGEGKIFLAGEVDYQTGPVTIRLQPGVLAKSIQLTEELTDTWLKDIAPAVMRLEKIHGTVSAEIDEATIVIGAPDQTHVAGRLLIHRFQMSLTPLMQQFVETLKGMQAIARRSTRELRDKPDSLIVMPTQSVDFDLNLGFVKHKQSLFKVGQTKIMCSGYVTLGGRLALIAKIPRDDSSVAGSSAGPDQDFVTMPISGTVDRPIMDPTGLISLTTLMTNRTAFESVGKMVQEQIGRTEVLFKDTAKMLGGVDLVQDGRQSTLDRARVQWENRESGGQASTIR